MDKRRSRLIHALRVSLLMSFGCGVEVAGDFECEEAVARLKECCPELNPRAVDCTGGVCNLTDLNLDESTCIQALSCTEIRELDLCTRVPAIQSTSGSDAGTTRPLIPEGMCD